MHFHTQPSAEFSIEAKRFLSDLNVFVTEHLSLKTELFLEMAEFPERPMRRLRSISSRLHGGWISDSEYLGELSLLCNEVSFVCLLLFMLVI